MKKKFIMVTLSLFCAVCVLFSFAACGGTENGNESTTESEHAHTYNTDNICTECGYKLEYTEGLSYYYQDGGYVFFGGGTYDASEVTVAAYYNGLPVTKVFLGSVEYVYVWVMAWLANGAITEDDLVAILEEYYGENITAITIPDGISEVRICEYSTIESITASQGIDNLTIASCENLTDVYMPSSLTNVYLYDCPKLETETENGITYYKNCVLSCDENLTMAEIREGTTIINYGAFGSSAALREVEIPASMKCISEDAFYGCSSLTNVVISEGVEYIGEGAFYHCTSLESIIIPYSVTAIGRGAFMRCTALTSVTFENTSGWYVKAVENAESSTDVDVADSSLNAAYLTYTYCYDYWYRSGD